MNRQQRRAERKATPAYLREPKEGIQPRLVKNGITVNDLKVNYEKGYNAGFRDASQPTIQGCFAAVCLALNEIHGFGRKRLCRVLNAIDQHMTLSLSSMEAIEEVYEKIGLRIDFNEAFDRVQEV